MHRFIIIPFLFFIALRLIASPEQMPNILIIQADDLGYDDLAIHGNPDINTPNIDGLGQESHRFTHFHLQSVCAPSRAALLTGRHFVKTGVSGVHAGRDYVNLGEIMMPEVFRENGYVTGMWGKWHSGKTHGYMPWDRGFDEAYYASLYNYWDNVGLMNGEKIETEGYVTDRIADMAIEFIRENKDRPFFAYFSSLAPHNPWRAPEKTIQKYRDVGLSDPLSKLYAMIDNLDMNVGRLLVTLDELGIADNTIVVFVSDNGPHPRSYRFGLTEEEWERRNHHKFKGNKGTNWQNGVKSPLFIRWSEKVEPGNSKQLCKIEDIFPTLTDFVGIQLDPKIELDGMSLNPFIAGKKSLHRSVVISQYSPIGSTEFSNQLDKWGTTVPLSEEFLQSCSFEKQTLALIRGNWKYLQNQGKEQFELYNLSDDPIESQNLAALEPGMLSSLQEELRDWFGQVRHSKHAYQMPEMQIGYDGRERNIIYACTPFVISEGLSNTSHFLAGWSKVGDRAAYRISVETPGNYRVVLLHRIDQYQNLIFKVGTGNSFAEKSLAEFGNEPVDTLVRMESAYWDDFDLLDTWSEEIGNLEVGTIFLSKEDEELIVELRDVSSNHVPQVRDQIIAIELIRCSD